MRMSAAACCCWSTRCCYHVAAAAIWRWLLLLLLPPSSGWAPGCLVCMALLISPALRERGVAMRHALRRAVCACNAACANRAVCGASARRKRSTVAQSICALRHAGLSYAGIGGWAVVLRAGARARRAAMALSEIECEMNESREIYRGGDIAATRSRDGEYTPAEARTGVVSVTATGDSASHRRAGGTQYSVNANQLRGYCCGAVRIHNRLNDDQVTGVVRSTRMARCGYSGQQDIMMLLL